MLLLLSKHRKIWQLPCSEAWSLLGAFETNGEGLRRFCTLVYYSLSLHQLFISLIISLTLIRITNEVMEILLGF